MNKKIMKLAKEIEVAVREVGNSPIYKECIIGEGYADSIVVASLEGFRCIAIGNLEPEETDGFMFLIGNVTKNKGISDPYADDIAVLLQKVIDMEKLDEGDGKARYFVNPKYGEMKKQLNYFSKIVKDLAGI